MSEIEAKEFILKNGIKGVIRCAAEDDAERLLVYLKEVFQDDQYFVLTGEDIARQNLTVEKEKDWIKDHQKTGSIVLIAEIDNEIVGLINVKSSSFRRLQHVGVLAITILEQYRSSGLGSRLMETVLDWPKENETIEKVALSVHATNLHAQRLYHKFGFVEEGRKIKEIKMGPGEYVDSILMYKFVK